MKNIGSKIITCGKIAIALGVIISIILWVVLLNSYDTLSWTIAWIIIVVGPLCSLFFGLITQGFGIIVKNAEHVSAKTVAADPMPIPKM